MLYFFHFFSYKTLISSLFFSFIIFNTLSATAQDTTPPSPDPAIWRMPPVASGASSIKMAAAFASDASGGVEYYFECTSGNCNDSGWQTSNVYEDTGLVMGSTYTYRFKVRDTSSNQNETAWSEEVNASPIDEQAGGFTYNWANYDDSETNGFGAASMVNFDFTGVRSISHAPPVGVHPRIFFNPEDIPAIKNRWENTPSGAAAFAQIHAYTMLLNLGYVSGGYNHNSAYGRDAFGNKYIDNAGFWDGSGAYNLLVAEDATVWTTYSSINNRHRTACLMAMEALECLVYTGTNDPDTGEAYDDRAADLATAMAFWASLVIGDATVNPDGQNFNYFGGTHMALCYDLNYNAMTTAQRDVVRQALAQITPTVPRYGENLASYATASNWTTLNSFEIICNLAIEGEAGYKPDLTFHWMRTAYNFLNYGWYPSGAGLEGLGKNYQFVTTLVACAKRGYSLLGHPHVRAYGQDFLPAITQPFGHGFTSYDVWGGSGYDEEKGGYKFSAADAVGLKWAFPNDASVDFVWRNYIEKWYFINSEGYVYQQIRPDDSYYNYLIPAAIFTSDYNTGSWDSQNATAQHNTTDYFAPDRGLAVLRSGFTDEDLAVQFHCRQDMGGHTHGDRNDFTLSGLGRMWVKKTYGGSPFQPTYFHSCVLIDDLGMGVGDPDGDKCRQPGTILAYQPTSDFSMVAGDATYAYTWEWHWQARDNNSDHSWLGSNNWEAVTETLNDFQYQQNPLPHYNIPMYDFAHWSTPFHYERMVKRPYNPMERVMRSVGMIKGAHPYALIVDDVQKDGNVHNYKWVAQIARDLTIESTSINLVDNNYECDIILEEPSATGNRRLLVRVLQNSGYNGSTPPGYIDELDYIGFFNGNTYNSNPNWVRNRLVIENNSISPDFKVLLFPYEVGDPLPLTTWNPTHDTLTVSIGTQINTIAFEAVPNDRTLIHLIDNLPHKVLDANILLEGVYNTSISQMNTDLRTKNLLPLQQPYNTNPWNYAGTEVMNNLNAFPFNTVDWVLVEVRDANNISTIVEQRAALLQADGTLVDASHLTQGLRLYNLVDGNDYYLVIRHRNHVDVMSANVVTANANNNNISYDFTQSSNVMGTITQVHDLGSGIYGLIAADFNGDGVISVADFNDYVQQASAINQYLPTDANLDGHVSVTDFNWHRANASVIGVSHIRY